MVWALFLRLGGLNPHTMRLRLFAVKANANREQNLPSLLGQLCRDVALLIQRRKDGSCVSVISNQSVILVSFFSLCLKRGYRKKGEDRSGVSDFILKGAALYAERFVHHSKVLCISTENVKGWWYLFEIEGKWRSTLFSCSQNVPNNKSLLVDFCQNQIEKYNFHID